MATSRTFLALAAASLALGGALLPAAPAAAQMSVNLISIGDKPANTVGTVKVSLQDCEDDVEIVYELDNVPATKSTLDVYRGSNCNSEDRNNTDTVNCEFLLTRAIEGSINFNIEIATSELRCEAGQNEEPTLWFLAVNESNTNAPVMDGEYTSTKLSIDALAPKSPTSVKGGSGENQIPISWKTSDADLDSFIVYIDSNATFGEMAGDGDTTAADDDAGAAFADGGGDCGSSVLVPGSAPPTTGVTTKTVNNASASGTNLSSADIDGDRAAVAVVAVDEAGNESPLSGIACVEVVPTTGFWDQYSGDDGTVEGGCPCAAIGPVHAQTAWPVGLALCALGLRRRRSRKPEQNR